ncbi:MAG: OmpA family protein, partial [Planctomycetes bacterium]|nr:OmpA family protein [Planctomycetota bacterium]
MRIFNLLLLSALLICGGSLDVTGVESPPFVIVANQLQLPVPIAFTAGGATITDESAPALAHIAAFLAAKPAITLLRVEGHTDDQGDAAAELALTQRRALAVVAALVARGVVRERLIAVGFGGSKPVADQA